MGKERMAPLILFVCTGNTCRSAMAEHFCHLALPPGSRWQVKSAGLFTSDGKPASENTIQAVAELGSDIRAHRSRQISQQLVSSATVIVAMTHGHADYLRDFFPDAREKLFLLGSFIPDALDDSIDDPYGGSLKDYRACRDLIRKAIRHLLGHLEKLN